MAKIIAIVEGDGEVEAVPALIRRFRFPTTTLRAQHRRGRVGHPFLPHVAQVLTMAGTGGSPAAGTA